MTKILQGHNLQKVFPRIAKQWHTTRNRSLTAKDVTPFSNRKVWWICKKGHEWKASVCRRSNGNGCPYCSGRKVCKDNCLATVNPELAQEWHSSRNKKLTPRDVTAGSGKKVWWICKKGHEWQAVVFGRSNGNGCPYCTRQLPTKDNNLKVINPKLAKQWHPVKNGKLTPKNVTPGSYRKVWWICRKGHEWQAIVHSRGTGKRCPYCTGKKTCMDNCLATVNPKLAKQWHPSRNGKLTPKDVTAGSGKKVWWKCRWGHVWKAVVNSRNRGTGCSKCRYINSQVG